MDKELVKKLLFRGAPPLLVVGLMVYYTFRIGNGADKLYKEKAKQEQLQHQDNTEDLPADEEERIVLPEAPVPKKIETEAKAEEVETIIEEAKLEFRDVFNGDFWLQALPREWLKRFVSFADEVGNGCIPTHSCGQWRSEEAFSAVQRNGKWYVSPKCMARYAQYVDILARMDAKQIIKYYRASKEALNAMLMDMGYAGIDCDGLTKQALETFANLPLLENEPELIRLDETHYVWADANLEKLSPVQKLCFRMGWDNARRIHDKAAELLNEMNAVQE